MSRNYRSNFSNISNEQLYLIDLLNTMYNDNVRQIQNYNNILNELNENNNNIRQFLIQILNTSNRTSNSNSNRQYNRQYRNNNNNNNSTRQFNQSLDSIYNSIYDLSMPIAELTALFQTSQSSNSETNNTSRFSESFLAPVEVYPTQSQIEEATRIVRYSDIVSPINSGCPISMEPFNDNNLVSIIRHCGHIFNTDNLNTWFQSNCRCPVCRYDIRMYNLNSSSQNLTSEQTRPSINATEERGNRITPSSLLINSLFTSYINSYFQDLSGNVLS